MVLCLGIFCRPKEEVLFAEHAFSSYFKCIIRREIDQNFRRCVPDFEQDTVLQSAHSRISSGPFFGDIN